MFTTRTLALAALPLFLATSVGCKQLLKGADEAVEVGRRLEAPPVAPPARLPAARMPANTRGGLPTLPAGKVADPVLKAVVQVGAKEAVKLAADLGAVPDPSLPDLSGSWAQSDDLGNDLKMESTYERRQVQPGVYEVDASSAMLLLGMPMMVMHEQRIEVIDGDTQCQWSNTMRVEYPSADVRNDLQNMGAVATVDDLSEPLCSKLTAMATDEVVAVDEDGVRYVERRVR